MSWATCYSGSNNIHHKSPALMSDSRQFTNYDAACHNNNHIKKQYQINSNYAYRKFLINNCSCVNIGPDKFPCKDSRVKYIFFKSLV